jgi:hypothetical protein
MYCHGMTSYIGAAWRRPERHFWPIRLAAGSSFEPA